MCFYIGIEDLAANALIEVLKRRTKDFLRIMNLKVMVQKWFKS